MMSKLLDEQNIRRRQAYAGQRSGRATDHQERSRTTTRDRRRVATIARMSMLGLAVGALAVGVVMVGSDASAVEALSTTVVPDQIQRAQMSLPGSIVAEPSAPGEVSFERTEESEYIVAEGETLSEIAIRFDLTYETLAGYNELENPDTLLPGQRLLVPSANDDLSG